MIIVVTRKPFRLQQKNESILYRPEITAFLVAAKRLFWLVSPRRDIRVTEYFTIERTIELLNDGEIVHVEPQPEPVIEAIASSMVEDFGRVREVVDSDAMMSCLWAIRRGNHDCVPFIHFEQIGDYRLWQNVMLFDRYRTENEDAALPLLLIGTRDVFGPELGGKSNDVLSKKTVHLVAP